jgi:hypothetical protein
MRERDRPRKYYSQQSCCYTCEPKHGVTREVQVLRL